MCQGEEQNITDNCKKWKLLKTTCLYGGVNNTIADHAKKVKSIQLPMTRILCDPPLSVGPITGYLHWSAPAPRLARVRCSDAGAEWHPAVASQPAHTAHTPAADMVTLVILWGWHQQADNNVCFKLILAFSCTDLSTSQIHCSQPSCFVFFPRKCGGVSRDGDVCR